MTAQDYLDRSRSITQHLTQMREQIDQHVIQHGTSEAARVKPLLNRVQELIDALNDLDKEFFGNA